MANQRSQAIHPLNGEELRNGIYLRVKQGVEQAMLLRAMQSFPLVRYRVTIEVIPYRSQGNAEPLQDAAKMQKVVVEGHEFIEVTEEGAELVHDSQIIGWDKDPQVERAEVGLGRVETRRVEGQYVDANVGATMKIEEPELPPPSGRTPRARQTAIKPTLAAERRPIDVSAGILDSAKAVPLQTINPADVTPDVAAKILNAEAETWSKPNMDPEVQQAIASEQPLPGRVTMLKK